MRKRTGYALVGIGVVVALAAYVLRSPTWLGFNGHLVEVWLLWVVLGTALFALGVVMVARAR